MRVFVDACNTCLSFVLHRQQQGWTGVLLLLMSHEWQNEVELERRGLVVRGLPGIMRAWRDFPITSSVVRINIEQKSCHETAFS